MPTRPKASIEDRLTVAQVAIDNALGDATLQQYLAAYGYDTERMQAGKQLYERALSLCHRQQAAYGEQYAATDALNAARAEANDVYMRHLRVARIAFKEDDDAQQQLALAGRRERALAGWIVQVRQFYTNALGDEEVRAALGQFGITSDALEAGLALVDGVAAAKARQQRRKGDALDATEARNEALRALDEWMRDFTAIARVALEEEPQLLEMLGIVVP